MNKKISIGIIGVVILVGLMYVVSFFLSESKMHTPLSQAIGQEYPNQGQLHIDVGASHELYNSNPPTSGPHYVVPATWGIYQNELPDEQLIHNLEHGGIWISYNPTIDAKIKAKIETLAKQNSKKMIVTPRAKNDALIVLASWRRSLTLASFDEDTIRAFIRSNINKSPESYAQ